MWEVCTDQGPESAKSRPRYKARQGGFIYMREFYHDIGVGILAAPQRVDANMLARQLSET